MSKNIRKNKKVELLAPAGSLSKLKYALHYGADAVYLGIPDFSLRVRINQFSSEQIKEAIEYAHKRKKKVYVTLNIYAHNYHLNLVKKHLQFLSKTNLDGVIISDPGIIMLVKKYLPKVDIHLSTQANTTNYEAVRFWKKQGVKRVILAREVTLEEIKEISKKVKGIELEVFIHGAMCMSYSGRCILSKWMNNRSANLGDCTQPCRWSYRGAHNVECETHELKVIESQKHFEVDLEEDRHGTYFFNSYDLNLLDYVQNLIEVGVVSLKIEGRAKSAYYVAVVTRAYRKVVDAINNGVSAKELKNILKTQQRELGNLINRGYTTGFLLGSEPEHNFSGILRKGEYQFVGEIIEEKGDLVAVKVHNAMFVSDTLEAITPEENMPVKIKRILDWKNQEVLEAHGGHDKVYYIEFSKHLSVSTLLRRKIS